MIIPLKTDIVYYKTPSDFEFEFNLNGYTSMRLLSAKAKNDNEFIHCIKTAVDRSQIIIVIGSLKDGLVLDKVCDAVGYKKSDRDLSIFGCNQTVSLPESAIPLVTSNGFFGGCVIECGPQSIIVLTPEAELKKQVLKELVRQYIVEFASLKNTSVFDTKKVNEGIRSENKEKKEQPATQMDSMFVLKQEKPKAHDFSQLEKSLLDDEKPKKKKRHFLKTAFFTLLFLALGAAAYIFFAEPLIINQIYSEYSDMYGAENDFADPLISNDFGLLYRENKDTVGFLKIHGCNISLPVTSEAEREEGYYNQHLFNGWYNPKYATLHTAAPLALSGAHNRNTVIYGKELLSEITDITTLAGYRLSPTIDFDTLYRKGKYKVFSVFKTESPENYIKTEFADDDEFIEYTDMLIDSSSVYTTVFLNPDDEIITIVYKTDEESVLVFARRIRSGESFVVDTQGASETHKPQQEKPENKPLNIVIKDTGVVPYTEYSEQAEQYQPPKYSPHTEDENVSSDNTSSEDTSSEDINTTEPEDGTTSSDIVEEPAPEQTVSLITIYNSVTGAKETGTVSDIISQIVAAEMGDHFEEEALKAQAVATYSWLLANGIEQGEIPHVNLAVATQKIKNAVNSVLDVRAYYEGEIAETYYHKHSAGATADSDTVWGKDVPYLKSVPSSKDRNSEKYFCTRSYSASDVAEWVRKETGIDLMTITDRNDWFHVVYDPSGYARAVRFGADTEYYPGRFLRERIFTATRTGYDNTLTSISYTIEYRPDNDSFTFIVKGAGHGVGMSQYGANELAKSGKTYIEILQYYFVGITVE